MRIFRRRGSAVLAGAGALALLLARRSRRTAPPVTAVSGPAPVAPSAPSTGGPSPDVESRAAPVETPEPVAPPPLVPAAVPPAAVPPAAPSDPDAFRPDVEGLRGVAILLVLLFHGALPVPGGFIGVDVFFVISGFLITGMLLREVGRSGRIALDRFYARRIRRLLPAAVVLLAVMLPTAYAVVAPLDRGPVMDDGMAAMLSVSNIRFALADGDYFAAASGPSPFLHFWSLSLEEQFYLFWPLVLVLVARGRRPNLYAGLALGLVLVASLAASVLVTDASATSAFYSLPTRAWQFAAGGLLAIGGGLLVRVPSVVVAPAGWVGLGVVAAGALLLDGSVPYPGLAAAIPTGAAVLLIASGERRLGPGRLLATPPLRFLGRISYSLYLWHWPILLLPAIALGVTLEPAVNLALCGVAVVAAWISWAFVERRFRYPMARGSRAPRRSLAMGAVSMVTVVALAWSLGLASVGAVTSDDPATAGAPPDDRTTGEDLGPVAGTVDPGVPDDADATTGEPPSAPDVGPTPTPATTFEPDAPVPSPSPGGSPAPDDPASPAISAATPVPAGEWVLDIPARAPSEPIPLPRDVLPSLAAARSDIERLFADGCVSQTSDTRPKTCVYGDRDGALTVALVGDSHASHWFPAFNVLATRHGWRLLPYVKVSCPFVDMPVTNLRIKREYTECATWRGQVIERLNRERPDLVVVASGHRAIIAARTADATPARQGAAMGRAVAMLGSPVAILIDTPRVSYDIPGCLSRHRTDVRRCAMSRSDAFPAQFGVRERLAAETTGAALIDLVAAVCPATPCQVARDGMILYRDNHHLTATFARSLAGPLDAALAPLMAPAVAPTPQEPAPTAPAPPSASGAGSPAPRA